MTLHLFQIVRDLKQQNVQSNFLYQKLLWNKVTLYKMQKNWAYTQYVNYLKQIINLEIQTWIWAKGRWKTSVGFQASTQQLLAIFSLKFCLISFKKQRIIFIFFLHLLSNSQQYLQYFHLKNGLQFMPQTNS